MDATYFGAFYNTQEAATNIADEPGTGVALFYRSKAFSRAKEKIVKSKVILDQEGETIEIDAIIVSAGGILPTGMLK